MSPNYSTPESGVDPFTLFTQGISWLMSTTLHVALGVLLGWGVARLMRSQQLNWTWAAVAFVVVLIARPLFGGLALTIGIAALAAAFRGRRWRREDIEVGGDLAQLVRSFVGPLDVVRGICSRVELRRLLSHGESWFRADELLIGQEQDGRLVRIPLGGAAGGTHTLVVGATGSGKTVTETGIAVHSIEHGMAAVVVDPKGDARMLAEVRAAAERMGRPFVHWTPEGSVVWNPFARGSATQIADKLLAVERFSEPHYLRQAQRYLGHVVRVLREAGIVVSLANVVRYLDPQELEVLVRGLLKEKGEKAEKVEVAQAYLASLTDRQRDGLSGVRDRLAIMAESDVGRWLDPETPGARAFDLLEMIERRAVVYFNLEADSRPLLANMLGAAIVQDLQTTVAALQGRPVPTLVVIDEFSAVSADQVTRLFGRARSAGMSLVLGTQELSDLRLPGLELLLEQVMGNLSVLIAHRQVVPASATLIADVAGTQGAWAMAVRSNGDGTSTRGREYRIHPDDIKTLPCGCAVVIVPTGKRPVRVTQVFSLNR